MNLLQPVVLLISVWLPVIFIAVRWLPLTGPGRYLFCVGASGIIALIASGALLWAGLVISGHMMTWLPSTVLIALALAGLSFKARAGSSLGQSQPASTQVVSSTPFVKAVGGLLVILIALRIASLLPDVLLRPLFAWDAWTVWGYEARLWLETGGYVDFLPPGEWLTAPAGEFLRDTLVSYPKLIPALIMWVVPPEAGWTGVGPGILWLSLLLCISLVLAGTVRLAGAGPIWALGAAYVFISLPLVNAHVALYGYADLWVAAALSVFGGLLVLAERDRRRLWVMLAVLILVPLPLLKVEGSYWLICGLVALLVFRLGLSIRALMVLGGLVTAGILGAAAAGLDVLKVATFGRLSVSTDQLGEAIVGGARHAFVWHDWHLLIFIVLALLAVLVWRPAFGQGGRLISAFVILGLVMLWGFTPLTGAGQFLSQGTLFSRIILQFSPALVLFGVLVIWKTLADNPLSIRSADSGTDIGFVLAATLSSAVVLWAGFTGWIMTEWGSQILFPKYALEPEPERWRMVEGQGEWAEEGFKVLASGRFGRAELAIDLPIGLRVSDYSHVGIRFKKAVPSNLSLGWSTTPQFQASAMVSLEQGDARSAIGHVSSDRQWRDPVYFLSVEQMGFIDGPWTVESVELVPGPITFMRAQQLLLDSFYVTAPWVQRNPHFLWPTDPVPRISLVMATALWVFLAVVFFRLYGRSSRHLSPLVFFVPLAIGWLVVDLRWQVELGHKAYATVSAFAGMAPEERFENDLDGSLYDFVQTLRESHSRSNFERVFALSSVEFWRKRARYHLAAWDVRPVEAGSLDVRMAAGLQRGDLLLFLRTVDLDLRPVSSEAQQELFKLNLDRNDFEFLGEKVLDQGDWIALRVVEIRDINQ
jgi:hypothetical protein